MGVLDAKKHKVVDYINSTNKIPKGVSFTPDEYMQALDELRGMIPTFATPFGERPLDRNKSYGLDFMILNEEVKIPIYVIPEGEDKQDEVL